MSKELTYEEKLAIANKYINRRTYGSGLTWDDLADINSLHDAEAVEDIIELADERLSDSGYPDEDDDDEYESGIEDTEAHEDDDNEERATTLNEEPS